METKYRMHKGETVIENPNRYNKDATWMLVCIWKTKHIFYYLFSSTNYSKLFFGKRIRL